MPRGKTKTENKQEILPKYLRLVKGAMWSDDISGVTIYDRPKKDVFIGRETILEEVYDDMGRPQLNEYGVTKTQPKNTPIEKDKFDNKDDVKFGFIERSDLPWFIDTTKIPKEKQARLILAYRHGILSKADPKNPPDTKEIKKDVRDNNDFSYSKNGDRIFVGKNNTMYTKLQNNDLKTLISFIRGCPNTDNGRRNLLDLLEYEQKGYNRFSRPRGEVLDVIREKLNEFGSFISPIRKNDI